MDATEFLDPFQRLLGDLYAPEKLRVMEADDAAEDAALDQLSQSGFLDIMRSEADGGAGLSLLDSEPLIRAIGAQAAPAQIALVMAEHASKPTNEAIARPLSAVIHTMLIAGALEKLLEICVDYANMREQFGKPIGRQQSLQHMLAQLAEQAALIRVTGQYGASEGLDVPENLAAVAKYNASAAVPAVTSIAHAVHGAIGVTQEYDLQLWIRRLYEWRAAAGSESYWVPKIGAARLAQAQQSSVDFALGLKK